MEQLMELYAQPQKWTALKKRIMKLDFSWTASAKEYRKLYEEMTGK